MQWQLAVTKYTRSIRKCRRNNIYTQIFTIKIMIATTHQLFVVVHFESKESHEWGYNYLKWFKQTNCFSLCFIMMFKYHIRKGHTLQILKFLQLLFHYWCKFLVFRKVYLPLPTSVHLLSTLQCAVEENWEAFFLPYILFRKWNGNRTPLLWRKQNQCMLSITSVVHM